MSRRAPQASPHTRKQCVSIRPGGSGSARTRPDFGVLDSWRAQAEDSMRVRVCPSWGTQSSAEALRGSAVSLFSCARARRVKSCRGSRAHTRLLRPWALSHTHTMRRRRLGLGLGPRALGSHTPGAGMPFSVSFLELRVAGRSREPLEPHNQAKS